MVVMKTLTIRKSVSLPFKANSFDKNIEDFYTSSTGLVMDDFNLFKPKLLLRENEKVSYTSIVATNKFIDTVFLTSPVEGVLKHIHRGEKRKILSVEFENKSNTSFMKRGIKRDNSPEEILKTIQENGLFSAFRQRPFEIIPDPRSFPDAIFITAMDTRPLSFDANEIIKIIEEDFLNGVEIISKLSKGKIYICVGENFPLKISEDKNTEVVKFIGKHPSGLVGTHIHHLYPINEKRKVWHINFQEVAAIGKLFYKGILSFSRYVAINGHISNPKIVQCNVGSNIFEILKNEDLSKKRVISGSPLFGRLCDEVAPFLGRYDYQITVLNEMTGRKFMEWLMPGRDVFSVKNVFLSKLLKDREVNFDTSLHGSYRPIVPVESYEKVFPFEIEITLLLRYLSVRDTEMSKKLGCLELSEEDISLCTFVCPGKNDYTIYLREVLDQIYMENI